MNKIQKLSQDVINKIAAGEVVDRPASVVKELTENAVDAGAATMVITIEQGGTKLIQVSDDGGGMDEENARLSIEPHATSKLNTITDLNSLHTLGFRGEALASISAVSQFELTTKTKDSISGIHLTHQSSQIHITETPAQTGTIIKVKNLFFNVPARQKFLKTVSTEFSHILNYVIQFSLIHPELNISLIHNSKTIINVKKSSWEKRVQKILGDEYFSQLVSLKYQSDSLTVKGFIGKPSYVHATHKKQHLFVNNRPVQDFILAKKVRDAYGTLIPRGYHPAYVLSLTINPEVVDVNIHPRKTEVKFQDQNAIYSAIYSAINQSIRNGNIISEADLSILKNENSIMVSRSSRVSGSGFKNPLDKKSLNSNASIAASRATMSQAPRSNMSSLSQESFHFSQSFKGGISFQKSGLEEREWKIIGQLNNSFILIETPEGLKVLDQHALSEIINYREISQKRENQGIDTQALLSPEIMVLNTQEEHVIAEHHELFKSLGWEVDRFSKNEYAIHAVPTSIIGKNIPEILRSMLDSILDESELNHLTFEEKTILSQACRSAVMFGDKLSMQEMEALISKWLHTEAKEACEHGRPSVININISELKKMFNR
jgi:DNA mismatch repair protein MutL